MNFQKLSLAKYVSPQLVMWKKVTLPLQGIFLKLSILLIIFCVSVPCITCLPARAVLLNAEPVEAVNVRRVFYGPYQRLSKRQYFAPPLTEDYYYEPSFSETDSFPIRPQDAVSKPKYSPPLYPQNYGVRTHPPQVNWRTQNPKRLYVPGSQTSLSSQSHSSSSVNVKPAPFYPSILMSETFVTETTVTSDYKVSSNAFDNNDFQLKDSDSRRVNVTLNRHFLRNNFTETNDSHALVPSDAVLKYHPPPSTMAGNKSERGNIEHAVHPAINLTKPNDGQTASTTKVVSIDSEVMLNDAPEVPVYEQTETSDPFDEDSASSTVYPTTDYKVTLTPNVSVEVENSSVAPPVGSTKHFKFSSGAVAGIVIAVLTGVTILTSSVIYLLYKRYNGQCTSVVESKFNSDNCGYLDDSLRSSVYLNNHIELPKENSEEMTSLDNDSFLNSLETMTIQNYWADNTKNTKV